MPANFNHLRTFLIYRQFFLTLLVAVFIFAMNIQAESPQDDMQVIRERLLAPSFERISADRARELVRTVRPDGSWTDVDYKDNDRAVWKTARHMSNILDLAEVYAAPQSPMRRDNDIRAVIMRALDSLMAFPGILLAMALVAVLSPGIISLVIALGVVSIPRFSRIARAAVLQKKGLDYVQAARALGT